MLNYLLKQGSIAAAYLGIGYGAAALNDMRASSLKAYYGNKEYDKRFHGYMDTTSSILRGIGLVGAGAAMFRQDPISTGLSKLSGKTKLTKTSLITRLGIAGGIIGAGASWSLAHPAAAIGTTLATAAIPPIAMGLSRLRSGKSLGSLKTLGLGSSFIAAGAATSLSRTSYPAAESSNVDIQHDGSSAIDRLNYSTAGLTFALHRNRRAL